MTDGTSQGLFIVVAIVIFGIFVVLAYILFEDTLSPSLANMFTEATESSSNRLNPYEEIRTVGTTHLSKSRVSPTFSEGNQTIYNDVNLFEANTRYRMTFDVTLNSGALIYIGGHSHSVGTSTVRINNKVSKNPQGNESNWNFGVPIAIEVGETKHVQVDFVTNRFDNPISGHEDKSIALTLGRTTSLSGYNFRYPLNFNATITNYKIEKYTY